ncbi:MAG: DNA polymerase III subunit gamma/tau [Sedimentisphaerales bacterium]|jgi:DNA polymerase-3 subunit gamma/tau|nr:DNA polymerase III subunit gamma/tau [Sedimentisphaerales bacterium]NLT78443.1 DNA polymerase III subunit gamma/tau [Planctomycetota bacterium]
MAYTVLARKYRSQTFDDVVGQDPISKTLKNAIETGRVAHAYLFSGTRGVGKTTMARILAKALNCLKSKGPTTSPCCKCDSCVSINTGEDIDVIEIDGASNNRVDEIRELRENAIYRPARARYKIYIIDEVHMLTTQAFNALLKTLEEPPEHVKFIFATTEPNKVIATIQSRCQRFDFHNINPKQVAGQLKSILKKEKIKYEDDLVLALAKMANGSMRDGLSLLDRLISTGIQPLSVDLLEDFLGRPNAEKVQTLVEKIGDADAAGTLTATEDLINTGLGEAQIVDALTEQMRDLLVIVSAGVDTDLLILTADQKERAAGLAKKFDTAALIYNITALEKLRWAVKNSDTPRALLDASLLRFALSEHFINVDELLARSSGSAVAPVKKKLPVETKPDTAILSIPTRPAEPRAGVVPVSHAEPMPEDLAASWPEVLESLAKQLSPATTSLLTGSSPKDFVGETLTIEFAATAKMQKEMCESNGRSDQIAEALSRCLGRAVRVRFTLADAPQADAGAERIPFAERQRQVLSDPGVKTVLMELGATVTGIEEE